MYKAKAILLIATDLWVSGITCNLHLPIRVILPALPVCLEYGISTFKVPFLQKKMHIVLGCTDLLAADIGLTIYFGQHGWFIK